MKYPKLKVFKPSKKEVKEALGKVAGYLIPDKVISFSTRENIS